MKITGDLLPYLFSFVNQEKWKYSRQQNKLISLTDLHQFCINSKYTRKEIRTIFEYIILIRQTKYLKIKHTDWPKKWYHIQKEYYVHVQNHECIFDDNYKYTSKIVIVEHEWDFDALLQPNLEKPVQKINGDSPCVIC
jgi:hypothetical protein